MHIRELFGIIKVFLIIGYSMGTEPGPDSEQEKFIKELNEARKSVAEKYKVPNMHELEYSEELVEYSKTRKLLKNYWAVSCRLRIFESFNLSPEDRAGYDVFRRKNDAEREQILKKYNKGSENDVEHYIPLQKRIGCAKMESGDHKGKILCVFGPEGNFHSLITPEEVPGSMCSPGYPNKDGLCSPDSSMANGEQLRFIADLNDFRRETAKVWGIPNMNEMIYVNKLYSYMTVKWRDSLETEKLRYFLLQANFKNGIAELKKATNEFRNQTVEERKKVIAAGIKRFVKEWEHVNPSQLHIAC